MLQKYEVIQAGSAGRNQPKEILDHRKTGKKTSRLSPFKLFAQTLLQPSAMLPTNTQALMQYMQQSRTIAGEIQRLFVTLSYVMGVAIPCN